MSEAVEPARDGRQSLAPPPLAGGGDDERTARRLQLFMGARLGVATLLLGGTLLLALSDDRGFDAFTAQFLVTLIGAIYASSLVFSIWLLGTEAHDRVAISQVTLDLFLTSGLVYVTGGAGSAFAFLYGVTVLMAAMVVGPNAARLAGAGAIFGYGVVALSLWLGLIPPPPDQNPEPYRVGGSELGFTILLNLSGLLLVTALASNLSARLLRAGGQLRLAEASAASLARLNDDIVRSLTSGLISTDLEGRIRTVNPMGEEVLRAPPDSLIDVPIERLLPVDIREVLGAPDKEGGTRTEGIASRLDGERFPVGFSINAIENVEGEAIGALILFTDLTEVHALREQAARQDRLAVLGRLSAGLAHEIRNPLSAISGSVQLVRNADGLGGEDQRMLGIVLDEVDRLDELVTTMIEVGKPRPPQLRRVDLRQTVDDITEMANSSSQNTGSVEVLADSGDAMVPAYVDPDQVRQVLWNLVKNAIQASPPGASVRVRACVLEDGTPTIAVSDDGAGIDQHQKSRIYDMFHSERTHGSGIGLALVRQIVDAHDAQIEIESDEGQGATFVVRFRPPPPASA